MSTQGERTGENENYKNIKANETSTRDKDSDYSQIDSTGIKRRQRNQRYHEKLKRVKTTTEESSKKKKLHSEAQQKYRKKTVVTEEQRKRNRERVRNFRLKRKETNKPVELPNIEESLVIARKCKFGNAISQQSIADEEFVKRFTENNFGFACSVCDRLWFKENLRKCPVSSYNILSETFSDFDHGTFKVCATCYASLTKGKIPRLSRSNGFTFPKFPKHLPELDIISERLISPRIPFMQIRRLRSVHGAKGIVGQVINVPVDVNKMVLELPRNLDDDYAFNVNIKRLLIHKTAYLSGYVKKGTVKAWLKYLLDSTLYKMYGIRIMPNLLHNAESSLTSEEHKTDTNNEEPLISPISELSAHDNELLIAKQHTLLWSEEKYLDIAPGARRQPLGLFFDEHAEELSFPAIYLGEPRIFKIENVTPFMMATSEIRRRDRRGVKPEHVLYMAMKFMRLRLAEGLVANFKNTGDTKKLTRSEIENSTFIESCVEQNLAFLKSIPNSVQYWSQRKKDVFAMIRQLGKPTLFLTLSASEYRRSDLLLLLYKLKYENDWDSSEDPVISMSSNLRTSLVNDDPVTCCIFFDKLVQVILHILQSTRYSPFGRFRVKDYFKRIEFQQRGSPHAHILLWLENDPNETVNESMPNTVQLIDTLYCVDPRYLECEQNQKHRHTFTCYKNSQDEQKGKCRFGAPFWPINETIILIPISKDDGRRKAFQEKYAAMHESLELHDYESLDSFLHHHSVRTYEQYLDIIRAGITRPRVFLKRTIQQKWINNFNPWIANKIMSNMDIQFILEEYSCACYVVEYVNKTNRGMSNLQRELIKLRDEHPDLDYSELLTKVGNKMLNAVEISSQEAAWYLLNLSMSEGSRKVEYIPTVWPHERNIVRKTKKQLDEEAIDGCSNDVWKETYIEKYEKRPPGLLNVSLAQFVAHYYKGRNGEYLKRTQPKVLRYRNYDMSKDLDNYKREMVLLHIPFQNEELDILDQNKYRTLYQQNEPRIMEARKEFESNLDIEEVIRECEKLCVEDELEENIQAEIFHPSVATSEDFVQTAEDSLNKELIMKVMENMSSLVRKRENVLSANEYCQMMRRANSKQRKLILEAKHRIESTGERTPLQIFLTGPAGSGKTFTTQLLMETYNRFSQVHNSSYNAYVSTASTGMAAAAINGTTVHSAFRLSNSQKSESSGGLSIETLNTYRCAFKNVQIVVVDECSMIGAFILTQVNSRLQQIRHNFERPFGGIDIVFIGDLRQLPPVRQTAIYKRTKSMNFCNELVWQSLLYYPLVDVMRQSDTRFSSLLTKIGKGEPLTDDETALIESRFVETEFANRTLPDAIRLFFRVTDVAEYNAQAISGPNVVTQVALDVYTGHRTKEQLASARSKVHKMKADETGGLPYMIRLEKGKPYMVRTNIDVADHLVNGAVGILRHMEYDANDTSLLKRLWLSFDDKNIGLLLRAKCRSHVHANSEIRDEWVPIVKRTISVQTKSKLISCKRTQFPIVEACAITIHKSQGASYSTVVYEYDGSHEQQLVYVAMSRATSIGGLFLTNRNKNHKFFHSRGKENRELRTEFSRLERNQLITISDKCSEFISTSLLEPTALSLVSFNVQSLHAHHEDVTLDSVLPLCKLMSFSETRIENYESFNLPGFRTVAKFKRNAVKAAGVLIIEKEEYTPMLQSTEHDLLKFDKKTVEIKRLSTAQDGVGDICAIETIVNNQKVFVVSAYVSPGTNVTDLEDFLELNLMAYSPKAEIFKVVQRNGYHKIPLIFSGDINIDLKSARGKEFVEFMEETFGLKLNNNPANATTRNGTCIDAVFSRYIDNLNTKEYISYFSHHRPLLSITQGT